MPWSAMMAMLGGGGAGATAAGGSTAAAGGGAGIADITGAETGAGAAGPSEASASGLSSAGASGASGSSMSGSLPFSPAKTAMMIGAVTSATFEILGGIDAAKNGSRVSGQYIRQAQNIAIATNNQINSQDYEANRIIASGHATAAAQGTTQGGSAKVIEDANYTEENLKDAYMRYSGALASSQAQYAAANARWSGKIAQQSAFVGAGTSLLTSGMMFGAL